jgi:hypothetical protein
VPTTSQHPPAKINPTPLPTSIAGLFHHEGPAACDALWRFSCASNLDLIAQYYWQLNYRMKFSFTHLLCSTNWLRVPLPHNDSKANTRFYIFNPSETGNLPDIVSGSPKAQTSDMLIPVYLLLLPLLQT